MNLDRVVMACNYSVPTQIAAAGAKAYVCLTNPGSGHDRVVVLVRSRSGRWVRKWEKTGRLHNFRPKTLPPEHPFYADERIMTFDPGFESMARLMLLDLESL